MYPVYQSSQMRLIHDQQTSKAFGEAMRDRTGNPVPRE
jgi:hypothetical protein